MAKKLVFGSNVRWLSGEKENKKVVQGAPKKMNLMFFVVVV